MSVTNTELRTDWFKPTPFVTHEILPSEIRTDNVATKADVVEFIIGEVGHLKTSLEENRKKIDNLVKLFNVVKGGNNISTTHQIVFNQSGNVETDSISSTLLKQFVADYGLNLDDTCAAIDRLEDTLEELQRTPTTEFCEVDIFNKDKEPVEC